MAAPTQSHNQTLPPTIDLPLARLVGEGLISDFLLQFLASFSFGIGNLGEFSSSEFQHRLSMCISKKPLLESIVEEPRFKIKWQEKFNISWANSQAVVEWTHQENIFQRSLVPRKQEQEKNLDLFWIAVLRRHNGPTSTVFTTGVSSPPLSPPHTIRFCHHRQATRLHSYRHSTLHPTPKIDLRKLVFGYRLEESLKELLEYCLILGTYFEQFLQEVKKLWYTFEGRRKEMVLDST
ncbi:Uncharacterized protein Fot_22562 [Forsythia ovata]|uniref:Uncharacterized protein n=1 Tax=Forsythia ovata TaxID=205694 RepID=A0ABD1UY31_9LAMI